MCATSKTFWLCCIFQECSCKCMLPVVLMCATGHTHINVVLSNLKLPLDFLLLSMTRKLLASIIFSIKWNVIWNHKVHEKSVPDLLLRSAFWKYFYCNYININLCNFLQLHTTKRKIKLGLLAKSWDLITTYGTFNELSTLSYSGPNPILIRLLNILHTLFQ